MLGHVVFHNLRNIRYHTPAIDAHCTREESTTFGTFLIFHLLFFDHYSSIDIGRSSFRREKSVTFVRRSVATTGYLVGMNADALISEKQGVNCIAPAIVPEAARRVEE
ncbi:MAG: hypothetical protein ACOCZI_01510 [Marinilabiliaceae bacterium]